MSSIKSLPLGIYEKAISNRLSWEEKFQLVKESGFDCLELSIDGTPERLHRLYDPSFPDTIAAAVQNSGVPIYTMALTANRTYPLGSEDDQIRRKGIEIVKQAIIVAEKIGIKVIHLAGYDDLGEKSNQQTKENFYHSIQEIIAFVNDYNVQLAIETMDAEFMGSCSNIHKLCDELNSSKLRIYADIGNLTGMGTDMVNELEVGGTYIVGVHVKDAKPGVMRDVRFGEGIVNFENAFRTLDKIGYTGCMIAETWSYDNEDFHPYLKEIAAFLKAKM